MLDLQLTSPIPAWLPDETLFSLASRFHVLSGNRLASATTQALFGSPTHGCEHDFPTNLSKLSRRTGGVLGDASAVAMTRTVLPFYLPLQTSAASAAALRSLVDRSDRVLKFRLGILTSRFRGNHPLKACRQCMSADATRFGAAYWHLSHQLPGVWVCHQHGELLRQSTVKSTGVNRFGWHLPDDATLTVAGPAINIDETAALSRLSELSLAWTWRLTGLSLSADALADAYRTAVLERFGPSALHVRRRSALGAAFCQSMQPLRTVYELRAFPAGVDEALAQIRQHILAPRGGTHPLRHIAVIHWLFEGWEHFWGVYQSAAHPHVADQRADDVRSSARDRREDSFLQAVREGCSISGAARSAGISVSTGLAWASRNGVAVRLKPKSLKPAIRNAVIDALRRGIGKDAVACQCGVSVQAITRVLQTESGLRTAWRDAQTAARRREARSTWTSVVSKFRGLSLTAIRHEAPAAYAWLRRHDRDWLDQNHPILTLTKRTDAPRVDWDSRDSALSAEVRRIAAQLAAESAISRVELWQIYQLLPELKAKLGVLERLPLTLKAIQETTGRRRLKHGMQLF